MSRRTTLIASAALAALAGCDSGFGLDLSLDPGCATSVELAVKLEPGGQFMTTDVRGYRRVVIVPPEGTQVIKVDAVAKYDGVQFAETGFDTPITGHSIVSGQISFASYCANDAPLADLGGLLGDLAGADLVPGCSATSCSGTTPYCDAASGQCVACRTSDDDCPSGAVCRTHACVAGCTANHPCGDAGACELDAGKCQGCLSDGDCGGPTPHCDPNSGLCQECINDLQCTGGPCIVVNGRHVCSTICTADQDCTRLGSTFACCSPVCIDIGSDRDNCGSCGMQCRPQNALGKCVAKACHIDTCNSPYGNCDGSDANGCETNLDTTVVDCNACGQICTVANGVAGCGQGQCFVAGCNGQFSDCNQAYSDGCEANLQSDVNNCNGCSISCPPGVHAAQNCSFGACGFVCNPGWGDCDGNLTLGCEADLRSNPNHCGGCTGVCPPLWSCVNSTCVNSSSDMSMPPDLRVPIDMSSGTGDLGIDMDMGLGCGSECDTRSINGESYKQCGFTCHPLFLSSNGAGCFHIQTLCKALGYMGALMPVNNCGQQCGPCTDGGPTSANCMTPLMLPGPPPPTCAADLNGPGYLAPLNWNCGP